MLDALWFIIPIALMTLWCIVSFVKDYILSDEGRRSDLTRNTRMPYRVVTVIMRGD